jgi:hypothetical protein
MTLLVFLVLLSAWRLARLAAVDEITRPLRQRIVNWSDGGPVGYLVTCSWCVSIWTTGLAAAPAVFFPDNRFVLIGLLVLAGSAFAGIMQTVEDRLDR